MEGPPFIHYEGRIPGGDFRFVHVEKISTRIRKYNWELFPHRHRDLFQMALIESGAGEVAFDLGQEAFTAPSLVLIPSLVVHSFRYAPRSSGRLLTISDAYLRELIQFANEPALEAAMSRPGVMSFTADSFAFDDIASAMGTIAERLVTAPQSLGVMLSANILRILGHLTHQPQESAALALDTQRRRLLYEQFRGLLEKHFREQLSVASYATMLAVNERTLHRACREVAGEPPLKIAHRRLVLEGQRLLLYSAMSVSDISYHLGFKDPSNFSRFFMEHVGESPLMFRRARLG
ncbi:MAG TPA: helix-turn-helix domain-containing protein [Pusillimonas sp.]|uniref:helix-turn-helix domain-containing protein n=1 Tax=unclassified Pusillimonas TaxID=2640016 RepID=UPI00262F8F1A|nr:MULTISPECIES: helix-turn-helix domain-containing protein [unclassified Pusillimonas]HLU19274.1 helix-turn-helix domain-containing protein [Pusillimonas sp.]